MSNIEENFEKIQEDLNHLKQTHPELFKPNVVKESPKHLNHRGLRGKTTGTE